jgi:hypothetical protein
MGKPGEKLATRLHAPLPCRSGDVHYNFALPFLSSLSLEQFQRRFLLSIMMTKKSCSPPLNTWQFLVLVLGTILAVAISIDIYIRLLLPEPEAISNTIPKLNPSSPSRTQQNAQPESQYDETVSIDSIFRNLEDLEDMSLAGDKIWESMFPKGGGYLYVRPNGSSTRSEAWGVSMFHSLHCLLMLRSGIQGGQLPTSDHENMARRFNLHISPNHMAHCISYLAQVRPVDHFLP